MSISPVTATMMVAASTAWGSAWNQPVKKATTSAISAAEMTPASGVLAPAAKLTTERANPPVTGKPPDTALARLAAPKPSSSRLGSMRCCRLSASDWATDTLSTKPTSEISSAGNHSACTEPQSQAGRPSAGKPCGTVPTTGTPWLRSSPHKLTTAVETITTSIGASLAAMSAALAGQPVRTSNLARYLRANHRNSTLAPPSASTAGLVWGKAWARLERV